MRPLLPACLCVVLLAASSGGATEPRVTLDEVQTQVEAAVQAGWKDTQRGKGPPFWQPATTPLVPLHWPPDGALVAYAYARGFQPGLSDGERVARPWARVIVEGGRARLERLSAEVVPLGTQGVRPVMRDEAARKRDELRRFQAQLVAARSLADLDAALARAALAGWRADHGVIAQEVISRHAALFAWAGVR